MELKIKHTTLCDTALDITPGYRGKHGKLLDRRTRDQCSGLCAESRRLPVSNHSSTSRYLTSAGASDPSWLRKPTCLFQSFFQGDLGEDLLLCEAGAELTSLSSSSVFWIPRSILCGCVSSQQLFQREPVPLEMLQGLPKAGGYWKGWEALTKVSFFKFQRTGTEFPKMIVPFLFFCPQGRQIMCLTFPLRAKSIQKNNWIDSVVLLHSCADRIKWNPQKHSDNIQ